MTSPCLSASKPLFLQSFSSPVVHMIGSGSVGLFLAAKSTPGVATLLLRDHHKPRIRPRGGRINGSASPSAIQVAIASPHNDNSTAVPAQLISNVSFSSSNIFKHLVITTKAFDALPALESVQSCIDASSNILILCNGGLAVRQELQDYLQTRPLSLSKDTTNTSTTSQDEGVPRIHVGSLTHGVYRQPSNKYDDEDNDTYTIVHAGVGRVFLPDAAPLTNLVNWPGTQVVSHAAMEAILWKKLAANSVCNPLTALYECTNGELATVVPNFAHVLHDVVSELVQVQHAIVQKEEETRRKSRNDQIDTTTALLNVDATVDFVHQVIDDNAHNRSSMQQDVYYTRRTEIDYLNGYTVQAAQKYGIHCPCNAELVERIQEVESNYPAA